MVEVAAVVVVVYNLIFTKLSPKLLEIFAITKISHFVHHTGKYANYQVKI